MLLPTQWRWPVLGGVVASLTTAQASAYTPSLQIGKYACVIDHAAGLFERNGSVKIGKLNTKKNHFIMDVRKNQFIDWDNCLNNPERMAPYCRDLLELSLDGEILGPEKYYGAGNYFWDGSGRIVSLVETSGSKPSFYIYEFVPVFEKETEEQYIYRGTCDKF
jgi:hypothetical protein